MNNKTTNKEIIVFSIILVLAFISKMYEKETKIEKAAIFQKEIKAEQPNPQEGILVFR